jgi:hypothetical protein
MSEEKFLTSLDTSKNVCMCRISDSHSGGYEHIWNILSCSQARNQYEGGSACCLLHAGFLLSLLSNIEDGGDTFLWNDG